MDNKSSKRNNNTSGKKKANSSKGGGSVSGGIDWNYYEEVYSKTGFAKKYGKDENKSNKSGKLPGRTVSLKSRTGNDSTSKQGSRDNRGKNQDEFNKKDSAPFNRSKSFDHKRVNNDRKTYSNANGRREDRNDHKAYANANANANGRREDRNDRKSNANMNSRRQNANDSRVNRNDSMCAYARKCGGCQLQGMEYAKQLSLKQKRVQELLGQFGKIDPIVGMKDPSHYRNKVHATFGRDRRGNYISGIYEEGTHEVVSIEDCAIQNKKANEIINSIRGLLKSFKIKTYDEDSGYGLLRHVLIRTGYHSGEVMVVLVLGSPILPSKNNFVKALRQLHPEITTVVINVNNKQTSMVLGDKMTTIYGKGYIEDTLCGCRFRISPKSFYQVNPVQTEVLYNTAIKLAGLDGTQKVIDAYCGIGTIGMIASKHAKEVIGVELNSDAVRDANANAKMNDIKNITFYNNDAGRFMVEMAEQQEHADVVLMDPPRAGSDETFMDSVAKLSPSKVVYVSCNPETLARDLEYMNKLGYKVKKMVPIDLFPYTDHCEMVCLLERKGR